MSLPACLSHHQFELVLDEAELFPILGVHAFRLRVYVQQFRTFL